MATATQQKAKSMAQQYQQVNNQNFIDNRTSQAYQQQKNDYNQQYDKQQNDMYLWAQNANSIKTTNDIIGRQREDNQQATQLQQRQSELAQQNSSKSGGSSSTAYGTNAPPPSGYTMNERGQSFYRPGQVTDWQNNQDRVATNNKRMSEADAAGDVLRTQANANAQERLASTQAAADTAKQAQQNNFNAQQAAADRASQERMRVLQGYSINPGSFQYWGGKV